MPEEIATWIQEQAPAGTAAVVGPIRPVVPAFAVEAAAVAQSSPRRRSEFLTGRDYARTALARLGCPPTAIPVGPRREPIWPKGFLGSISHSPSLCVAQVGPATGLRGVGVDLEPTGRLPQDLVPIICRPEEVAMDSGFPPSGLDPSLIRFVAKEALYKAYSPLVETPLEFRDLCIALDFSSQKFVARIARAESSGLVGKGDFEGRFTALADHAVACLWLV